MTLADGSRVGYAKLLLATGSSPRRLPVPGADLDRVLYDLGMEHTRYVEPGGYGQVVFRGDLGPPNRSGPHVPLLRRRGAAERGGVERM